jgi:hypothetical protein
MDADGKLSAEGAGRLRNAILFKAYGDSPTLARLVEATDPGSRNIAAALSRVAPAVADAREGIARGDLYPIGLHDDLIQAVEKIDNLRRSGMGVSDWSKQIDAFGDGMTAEARLLVQFLDGNIRAARQISDGIFGFYNRLLDLGNPKQGSMFEAAQPDKMRMLTLALDQPAPMYSRVNQTQTPEFKAWVGSSKLLDDDGNPQRFYHITNKDFTAFNPGGSNPSISGAAIWLSPHAEYQSALHNVGARDGGFNEGTRVLPVYVKMERPLVIDDKTSLDWAREVFAGGSKEFPQLMPQAWVDEVTKGGEYDGIIFKGTELGWGPNSDEIVVFEPTHIKSATGNRGTFDPANPDIRYSRTTETPLVKFLLDLTSTDEAFRYPKSAAKDINAVFAEVAPGYRLQPIINKAELRPKSKGFMIFPPEGGKGKVYLFDDGVIQVDLSGFKSGSSGGSAVYAALSDFAASTGRRFEGDSAGISLAGVLRRTENMLSTMLKWRGSDHVVPHPVQVDPSKHPNPAVRKALRDLGFTGIKWSTGDFAHNVAEIATQSYNVITKVLPEIRDVIVTEFGDLQRVSDGELLGTVELDNLARTASERLGVLGKNAGAGEAPGIGRATITRAAFVNTVSRAAGVEGGDAVLAAVGRELRSSGLGAVKQSFYSREAAAGTKADDLVTAFRAQFGRDADRLMEAGRVRVVQSVKDLPGGPHPDDVGGMLWRGISWIVADNTSLSQIRGRVLHEVGEHAGMEQMLGAGLYQQVLDTVALKAKTDPVFADALGLAKERANKPEHVPAEALAYLVENAPELKLVRRVLAAVRQWVYRTTGGRFVDLTQADLQMMAVASLRRYARAGEAAAGAADAPRYMTFFQGTPSVFKPEEGAPLGRLRWKFINTGEGAQAFGYGHYLAQQEWIARVRYRDRLVKRDARGASMDIDGPTGKITITGKDEPAYRIGDRLVHEKMGDSADGVAARIIGQLKNGSTVEEIRKWAKEDTSRLKGDLAAAERGFTVAEVSDGKSTWFTVLGPDGDDVYLKGAAKKMTRAELDQAASNFNEGFRRKGIGRPEEIRRLKQDIAKGELIDTLLPELTVEVAPKVEENLTFGGFTVFDGTGRRTDDRFRVREDAENKAASLPVGRVIRPDIIDVYPEPPKGSLYGKHIPDEEFEKFMVWDAPLHEQPPRVQEVFAKFGIEDEKPLPLPSLDEVLANIGWKLDKAPDGSPAAWRVTLPDKSQIFWSSLGDAEIAATREWRIINGQDDLHTLSGREAYNLLAEQLFDEGSPAHGDAWYAAEQEIMARRGFDDPDDFMEWRENADMDKYAEEVTSVILWQHGIPGHKFLDGDAKTKVKWDSDNATFNLVLYSDDLGKVAWESRNNDTEWVSANGRGKIVQARGDEFHVLVDDKPVGTERTIEAAHRLAEKNLDSFYSRTGDKMKPADPIEDTTMPGARMFADQAEAELAQANELSSGMLPAVECFLQVGQ